MSKNNFLFILIVIACAVEGCEEALERNISEKKITLLAPVNNLTTTDTFHTFYWDLLTGANQYQLQIVSPRFDSTARLITDTILNKNTFPVDLSAGTYQWRVRGKNSAYDSDFSDVWNLKIQ